MPNWCNNAAVIVFPDAEKAKEFSDHCEYKPERPVPGTLMDVEPASGGDFMSPYYPEPKHAQEDYWYSWRVEHWGCKWPASVISNILHDKTVRVEFDSAWSPPIEFFEHCGIQHDWKWELEYCELGMGFAGEASGGPDGMDMNEQYEYQSDGYETIIGRFGYATEQNDDT